MAYDVDYDDLDYGDEIRSGFDTISLPHDESNDGISEGTPVAFNGTKIVKADDNSSLPPIGVLYTYQYAGEDDTVRQNRDATVVTSGRVKARVAGSNDNATAVNAGEALGVNGGGSGDVGVFDSGSTTYPSFVALTDARQQDDDNPNGGTGEYYAEVLVR